MNLEYIIKSQAIYFWNIHISINKIGQKYCFNNSFYLSMKIKYEMILQILIKN